MSSLEDLRASVLAVDRTEVLTRVAVGVVLGLAVLVGLRVAYGLGFMDGLGSAEDFLASVLVRREKPAPTVDGETVKE